MLKRFSDNKIALKGKQFDLYGGVGRFSRRNIRTGNPKKLARKEAYGVDDFFDAYTSATYGKSQRAAADKKYYSILKGNEAGRSHAQFVRDQNLAKRVIIGRAKDVSDAWQLTSAASYLIKAPFDLSLAFKNAIGINV